jgi:hypothetical protein
MTFAFGLSLLAKAYDRQNFRVPHQSGGDSGCAVGEQNRCARCGHVRGRADFLAPSRRSALILFIAAGAAAKSEVATASKGTGRLYRVCIRGQGRPFCSGNIERGARVIYHSGVRIWYGEQKAKMIECSGERHSQGRAADHRRNLGREADRPVRIETESRAGMRHFGRHYHGRKNPETN